MNLQGPARAIGVRLTLLLCLLAAGLVGHAVTAAALPPAIVSSGSATLHGTYLFCFDTGTECSEGDDVWWDQETDTVRQMVPRGNAQLVNLGVVDFDTLSVASLQALPYSTNSIDGNDDSTNQLVQNDVFAVHTNGGNYAKVLIISYGYDLQIQWVTYAPVPSSISLSANSGQLGSTVTVMATGYAPNEAISISLQYGGDNDLTGTQVPSTNQTFTADSDGSLTATYLIQSPAFPRSRRIVALPPGDYYIAVVGETSEITNTLPFTIVSTPTVSPTSTATPTMSPTPTDIPTTIPSSTDTPTATPPPQPPQPPCRRLPLPLPARTRRWRPPPRQHPSRQRPRPHCLRRPPRQRFSRQRTRRG